MGNWRWWLTFYSLGMLILFVLGILSGFEGPMDAVNAILSAFAFVGVYGFLAKVPIGTRVFWQVYFWVFVVSSAVGLFLGIWSFRAEMTLGMMMFISFMVLLWLPMLMVVWLYAFVDQQPWSNSEPET